MRFIICIAVWMIFVGGLFSYTSWRDSRVVVAIGARQAPVAASHAYAIELTPTFSLEEDPFALKTDSGSDAPIELRLNGRSIPISAGALHRGRPLRLPAIAGVVTGQNEIHVMASPPLGESGVSHGLRVRLFGRETAIADTTLWAGGGQLVAGTVPFTVAVEEENHDH